MLIAEIGQNHCGDMLLAKTLIRLAKDNGADLAKFQLYDHNKLYANHPEIPNVELSFCDAKMLFDYGKEIGIEVFFSVFDVERVKWCEDIGVRRYKIASGVMNRKLWKAVIHTLEPIIFSHTGTYELPYPVESRRLTSLICPPGYPAHPDKHTFWFSGSGLHDSGIKNCGSGFSDHTIGLDAAKIALARGAQIVEKHFAVDHKTGADAEWSMTPDELRELKRWSLVVSKVL